LEIGELGCSLLILKTDPELALYGRYCISDRLKEEGFEFKYPAINTALQDIYQNKTYAVGLKGIS